MKDVGTALSTFLVGCFLAGCAYAISRRYVDHPNKLAIVATIHILFIENLLGIFTAVALSILFPQFQALWFGAWILGICGSVMFWGYQLRRERKHDGDQLKG